MISFEKVMTILRRRAGILILLLIILSAVTFWTTPSTKNVWTGGVVVELGIVYSKETKSDSVLPAEMIAFKVKSKFTTVQIQSMNLYAFKILDMDKDKEALVKRLEDAASFAVEESNQHLATASKIDGLVILEEAKKFAPAEASELKLTQNFRQLALKALTITILFGFAAVVLVLIDIAREKRDR